MGFLSFLSDIFNSNPQSHSIVSLSWAGYAVSDGVTNPDLDVIGISASWVIPRVNASGMGGYSSTWIGIGGQLDKTLIQVGTEQNLLGGQEVYSVWYEILPDYAIPVKNLTIRPQDTITASITLVDSATNTWNIQLNDITNGQGFSKTIIYNSTRSSGEWIVERPTVNNQVTMLSDFIEVTFNDCIINTRNSTGVIANYTASKIQMTNQQNTQLASVSPLNGDGSGFTVTYVLNS
jgi:hypothetical protein